MIIDRDMEQARSYYLLSAQQEFPDSQTALGMALLQAGDHAQGVKWLEMAAQKVSKPESNLSDTDFQLLMRNIVLHLYRITRAHSSN
jgi:TPR repeat protein